MGRAMFIFIMCNEVEITFVLKGYFMYNKLEALTIKCMCI